MAEWLPYPWQQDSWQRLLTPFQQGRLPHALLVSGEKGGGKFFLLEGFAKKALCHQDQQYACGQCKSCALFAAGSHPDYLLLQPDGKNIKIDAVRAMVEQLSQTAHVGSMKVVILAPAEAMNTASANALLKCLEEPTANTLIILLSHSVHRLLPTIRSRCQQIVLPKPSVADADQWLQVFVQDAQQRQALLQLANGNPLLARDYHEQEVLSILQKTQHLVHAYSQGRGNVVKDAEDIQKLTSKTPSGNKAELLEQWLYMNQILLWQMIQYGLHIAPESAWLKSLLPLIDKAPFQRNAYKLLEYVQQCLRDLQSASNPNPQLLIETLLMRWQQLVVR